METSQWQHRAGSVRCFRWGGVGLLLLLLWSQWLPVSAQQAGEGVTFAAGGRVEAVALTGDSQRLVVGTRDNQLHLLDADGQEQWRFAAQNSILGADISANGAWIAVASEDRHLYLLDGNGQAQWQFKASRPVNNAAVADDGSLIAATVDDLTIYAFDPTGALLWQERLGIGLRAVAIYGRGDKARVLIGSDDGWLTLYSRAGKQLLRIPLDYQVNDVAVTPNGAAIVAGTADGTVRLLDGRNGQVRWRYRASQAINGVAIASDGQSLLAGVADGSLLLFDANGAVIYQQSQPAAVLTVALSADGKQMAFGTVANEAQIIDREATLTHQANRLLQRRWLFGGLAGLAVVLAVAGVWVVRNTTIGSQFWVRRSERPRRLVQAIWHARLSYLLLLPTLLLLLTFTYYPAISGLYHAFTDWNPVGQSKWVGLENFRFLATDRFFIASFRNMIILVIAAVLKTLTIPLLAAELIFHLRNRRVQYWARTLFIVPIVLPMVVEILVWNNIYDPTIGLLNETLRLLGRADWARVWYGDANLALASVIFIGFPWVEAFSLLIFYGGLISISDEIFDAGKVDGANSWQRFWHLDLPLLLGQVKLLLILNFISAIQTFELVFLTTGGGPGAETYTPALELYYMAMRMDKLGVASAIGMVLFVIILIGTLVNMRYVRSANESDS
ncbi:MAG: PQQ-binding-like beta-propeller repeat protein [Caldilineaceae bacterium]|nr:PQQ-binding-like beta-propeller repeat protein [Caldilineaceae bacterium]